MSWESCCLYSITWRRGWEKEVHISTFQVNQRRTYINSVKTWLSMVRGRLCGRNSMNRAMERAGGETLWWPYPILSDSWHLKCFSTTLFQFVIHQSVRYLSQIKWKKCIYLTFSETFLVFLVPLVVFFGVKSGFRKSCQCKRNDKYEVCWSLSKDGLQLELHHRMFFTIGNCFITIDNNRFHNHFQNIPNRHWNWQIGSNCRKVLFL